MSATTGWVPETDFGTRLLLARKHLGLTVREAAMRCGQHYATWSTWERGSRPADMASVVEAISTGLGVNREWLMWGTSTDELGQSAALVRRNSMSRSRCTPASPQRRAAKVVRSTWLTMTATPSDRPAA